MENCPPVLLIVFNRPDHTKKIMEVIRKVKPPVFFVAADGPRLDKGNEREKCELVRKIAADIDWECEFKTDFSEVNLGSRYRPKSAIDWFFNNVDKGIILEDDCLPEPSFFFFCHSLLEKYEQDEEIMHIAGNSYVKGHIKFEESYYFSRYPMTWGWATWKRAWKYYDNDLKDFNWKFIVFKLIFLCQTFKEFRHWSSIFNVIKNGAMTTNWDFQWFFTLFNKNGKAIIPTENLIKNIGFGIESTHTGYSDWKYANMPTGEINSIIHPVNKTVNRKADKIYFKEFYGGGYVLPLLTKLKLDLRDFLLRTPLSFLITFYKTKIKPK